MYSWLRSHVIPYVPERIVVSSGHYAFQIYKYLKRQKPCWEPSVLAGMRIRSPIGLASGWADTPKKMQLMWELGAGFVTSKTITVQPRKGNPRPRLVRGNNGLINSMGLPNPGVKEWKRLLKNTRLRFPWIQSISGFNEIEYEILITELEPLVRVFEFNFSCPNTEKGLPDIASSIRIIKELASITTKPILVKLSPINTPSGNKKLLQGVHDVIHGVTLINTVPVHHQALGNPWKKGGLSGPIIYPVLIKNLRVIREEFSPEDLEVIAVGGIHERRQVQWLRDEFKVKIEVLTALLYDGPSIFSELCVKTED